MRVLFSLVATLTLTFILAGGAAAATSRPERGSFDNGYESFIDSEVCAADPWHFDVAATQHEYGFFDVWSDPDGNFVRAIVHWNYDAWIAANGRTILERDTWTSFFSSDGSRDVGLTVHIQGPGGIVVRDAGRIVRDANGQVQLLNGPHEALLGESFCPALVA